MISFSLSMNVTLKTEPIFDSSCKNVLFSGAARMSITNSSSGEKKMKAE